MTEPVLSATVPERTPFAWLYRSGQRQNTEPRTATTSAFLCSIAFPLGGHFSRRELTQRDCSPMKRGMPSLMKGHLNRLGLQSQEFCDAAVNIPRPSREFSFSYHRFS